MDNTKKSRMKGNKYFFLGGVCVMVLIAIFLRTTFSVHHTTILLGKIPIHAEIASTPEARVKGLSGRLSLPADEGMLFIFPTSDRYTFWMIDMHFPLDIIWLRQGVVVDIAKEVPFPKENTPTDSLFRYAPRLPADSVLEIPAGTADRAGVHIGDTLYH